MGFLWAAHAAEPAWEHALRTLLVMLAVLPCVALLLRRRRSRSGVRLPRLRHRNVVAAKIILVAGALGAEWLLTGVTDRASRYVAIGITLVVALLGPHLSRFFVEQPVAGTPQPSARTGSCP